MNKQLRVEKRVIEEAIAFVRDLFRNDFSGHDLSHTLRVYRTATQISLAEGADVSVVQLAALLHDADDRKLSPDTCESKDRAVGFMKKYGIDEKTIQDIIKIIEDVSFKGTDSKKPDTIEGACVQDADRLDAIGAIGIARTFAYGGNHHRIMYDPDIPPEKDMNGERYFASRSTTLNHFYEKLFLLKDMMNTETAKGMAEKRDQFMRAYVDEFLLEWNGGS